MWRPDPQAQVVVRELPHTPMTWLWTGVALGGVLILALVTILAVGVSHGAAKMGYAKPGRWWFWRRGS